MSDLYRHEPHKFADGGLQLRVPVDLVPPGQYARLTNAVPTIEGSLRTRAGALFLEALTRSTYTPNLGVHSLFRLNQQNISALTQRLYGIDDIIYASQVSPTPSASKVSAFATGLNGSPLTMLAFHYAFDSPAWAVIGERGANFRYRPGVGTGYAQGLGMVPPSYPAVATDAGVSGNLNSSGGPGYDWVYTYWDGITGTESEPSPVYFDLTNIEGLNPGTVTSPDPGFGGSAWAGNIMTALAASETRQSVLWHNWPSPTKAPYQTVWLQVKWGATASGIGGTPYLAFYFSHDNGVSWQLITDSCAAVIGGKRGIPYVSLGDRSSSLVALPSNTDVTQLQVRAVTLAVGDTVTPIPIIARRIRERGGNLNLAGILTGGGGAVQYQNQVISVSTIGVQQGDAVVTLALTNSQADVTVPVDPTGKATAINLYRRGGSVTAGWALVGQFAVTTLTPSGGNYIIRDNIADASLGAFVSPVGTNDPPVTSVYALSRPLPYLWGPAGISNRILGCGDPDRAGAVYFSNPSNADQWGASSWVDVSNPSDPIQNGCVYGTRNFAFSHERMFELVEGLIGGVTFTPFPTPCARGLISPWGLCVADAIYFVAKDGIYRTDGGPQESLTENSIQPLWPTLDSPARSVEGYDTVDLERVEDISLAYINNEIYFTYRGATGGALQTLIYDVVKNRWRAMNESTANFLRAFYSEPTTQAEFLMGDATGNIYTGASATADSNHNSTATLAIPVTIRTGAFDQGQPLNQKEYGNVIIDIDPGGATVANPVVITPLLNGEAITNAAINVTGTGRQQVPLDLGDVFGYNIELQITWSRTDLNTTGVAVVINPILYQFDILFRFEPVSVTHWEARETSHGLPGWMHIRDAYIAIRSTSTVTMSVVVDGVTTTYSLASTGGARRKVYVPFASNKGKLYQYKFDSADGTTPFRLYVEDIELRVKPWLTSLGYKLMKPFGGESVLAQPALESSIETGGTG